MNIITDERIMSFTQKAEDALWAAVANGFPEATSGALDPGAAVSLMQTMERGTCLG